MTDQDFERHKEEFGLRAMRCIMRLEEFGATEDNSLLVRETEQLSALCAWLSNVVVAREIRPETMVSLGDAFITALESNLAAREELRAAS